MPTNNLIMIESPYSGDIDRNIRYLDLTIADASINYNECPYASHGQLTRHPRCKSYFVSDYDSKWDILTRDEAICLSHSFRTIVDKTVFYIDRGWSTGMKSAKQFCIDNNLKYEERTINVVQLARRIPYLTTDFMRAVISDSDDYSIYLE